MYRIGVVGASSLAGKELRDELGESLLAASDFVLLDDEDVVGQVTAAGDEVAFIQRLEASSFDRMDFVFFAGRMDVTKKHWQHARRAGASIVDLTYALEGEKDVLVRSPWVAEVLAETMPRVALQAHAVRVVRGGDAVVRVTLRNPTQHVALMTHVQLRRADGERVLPQYADANYVTVYPGESTTVEITAATRDFEGHLPVVVVDGWNVVVVAGPSAGVTVETNVEALPEHWPVTGLPVATEGLR